jgi:hypothetical protein
MSLHEVTARLRALGVRVRCEAGTWKVTTRAGAETSGTSLLTALSTVLS